MTDAAVIGAGPNGLVAANMLADAGWEVLVLEAQPDPGGAVRSAELTLPGFCHDRFASFFPLAGVSSALRDLDLSSQGLEWCRSDAALAHVFGNGRAAVLWADAARTAESVEGFGGGDGRAWQELLDQWEELSAPLLAALLGPYPPVAAALGLGARLRRPHRLAEFVRSSLLPVRRFVAERFSGEGAAMLLAGNTLHTDLSPDSVLGGFYGWLLAMLGQTVGFPVPKGGSGALTAALVDRLRSRGGVLRCSAEVTSIIVRSGRAVGVRLADGEEVLARRGVAADVIAPKLYGSLLNPAELAPRFRRDLARFDLDHGTVKVDWALSEPIPWIDPGARRAGTVHVGEAMDHLTRYSADLAAGCIPEQPFILLGQMGRADPSRSPAGTETGWAYTHV
ncbi:MAG: phytoene desaturase family protein, partial [Acidimicrobiales bacterium]